jgi:quercetin dioxygenase-like cupin family protein
LRKSLGYRRLSGWLLLAVAATAQADADRVGFADPLRSNVPWISDPAIAPGGLSAVAAGDPRKAGPYVFMIRFPADEQVSPHSHPETRIYTVVSGTIYVGFGSRFDAAKTTVHAPGSRFVVPAGVQHFSMTTAAPATVEVDGVGPTATDYAAAPNDAGGR